MNFPGTQIVKTDQPEIIEPVRARFPVRDYALLLKPRVMSLVVFTGITGLLMAPGTIDPPTAVAAIICIALGAGAAGSINMWYDRDIDAFMKRTHRRPLPAGRLYPFEALWLGIALSVISVAIMTLAVNTMAGILLAITIAFYVFIYTMWLKRRTPQNIVIGGASGAFPPLVGWAAVTGDIGLGAVILFLIIFLWTPPHFWSLALYRCDDYQRVGLPMMPVAAGKKKTRLLVLVYTLGLVPVTLMPYVTGMSGAVYATAALLLGVRFIHHAIKVWQDGGTSTDRAMFLFSILYLFLIFTALLADRLAAILI